MEQAQGCIVDMIVPTNLLFAPAIPTSNYTGSRSQHTKQKNCPEPLPYIAQRSLLVGGSCHVYVCT